MINGPPDETDLILFGFTSCRLRRGPGRLSCIAGPQEADEWKEIFQFLYSTFLSDKTVLPQTKRDAPRIRLGLGPVPTRAWLEALESRT